MFKIEKSKNLFGNGPNRLVNFSGWPFGGLKLLLLVVGEVAAPAVRRSPKKSSVTLERSGRVSSSGGHLILY